MWNTIQIEIDDGSINNTYPGMRKKKIKTLIKPDVTHYPPKLH